MTSKNNKDPHESAIPVPVSVRANTHHHNSHQSQSQFKRTCVSSSSSAIASSPSPAGASSKVREYIRSVKESDEKSRKDVVRPETMLTLEELYETDKAHLPPGSNPELSKTLRALKEKDIMILKLRQSCSDLAIKCANAENTIDELRFGSRGAVCKGRKDVSVETDGRVLEQPCVDWLEKVQNWRADAVFHTSHEESCGDSGFRGSELDLKNTTMTMTSVGVGCGGSAGGGVGGGGDLRVSVSAQHNFSNTTTAIRTTTSTACTSKDHDNVTVHHQGVSVFSLDPLLDEATALAKRVKEKSVRLSQMLKEFKEDK